MKTRTATALLAAGLITAGLAGFTPAFAAGGHDHDGGTIVLKLNAGSKWHTDAALQQGMLKIRAAVEHSLPAVHGGTFTDDQYRSLGHTVEKEIAYIVQNCRLAPEADTVLHGIIAELADGVEVVTGTKAGGDRSKGVLHLVGALDNYGTYFSHPAWTPVATGH
ncbi:hypothetical protein [Aromatoleum anaerobium]|uniref:Uncharacterized protein n=1 Tax=Aromatoleum anaerobium TaxID=182180 RepID=A0ABX1PRE8_9RHOO|nr:hypothetical protein [Aromatoleum anaerobium]MCK0509130.1 hypothetical protein [Aromatoleum anaerobium]